MNILKRFSNRSKKLYINFFIFSVVLITTNVVIDFVFFANDTQEVALENASKKIQEREAVFKAFLQKSKYGLHSLRENQFFIKFLEKNVGKKELEEMFFTFSKAHNIFMQIRYIDKDGLEKIRVDRKSLYSKPFLVKESQLQNKASRYYFKDSRTKPLEKVWFSALDLNIENKKVQRPYNPTLRAILPIEHNGEFGGIIIINYFMESFLNKFLNNPLYDSILYDSDGYILKHFNKNFDWSSFNTKSKANIKTLYPKDAQKLLSNKLFKDDSIVSNKLDVNIANNIYLMLKLKKEHIHKQWIKQLKQYLVVAIITFILSSLITLLIVRKFNLLLSELEEKSQELEATNKNLKQFVDTQDTIVILTDGQELRFANKSFFKFFGFENISSFKAKYDCICEHFIENDRFFHLGKIKEEENWVEVLQTMPHSQRIVSMMGDDFKVHAFSVNISRFDPTTLIVSFTNISQTMLAHIELEEKTIHDKLTGAYNREYFDKNYERLIYEYTQDEFKLALALLDIDHFKAVNDTYGHDVGDYVLKHFVEIIQQFSRSYDVLIRWGGEEFIMIFKVKSNEDLSKALEHLRKVIELVEFETVGHKTCSFGGTIYKDNEAIEETIKRADQALYSAKNAGRNRVVIK